MGHRVSIYFSSSPRRYKHFNDYISSLPSRMVLQSFTPDLARSAGLADNRFPKSDEEADLAEQVLTRELEKLSLDEHERLLFDIHGICSSADDENVAFVAEKLVELDATLNKMKRKKKEAYEKARFLNKKYVESRDFKIMFLRSEKFNVKAAAETIISHFEIKRRIFGEGEVLARDVLQTDLNEEDHKRLQDGFIQVMPERDAAGRTIICLNLGFKRQDALASPLSRATWYFEMNVMKDIEAQKEGVIYLMYNYCKHKEEINFQREIHLLRNALPQRTHACHYCYNDSSLRPFVTGIRLFMDPTSRFRLRPHCGTIQELEYELMTFGIPTHASPMRTDGTWCTEWHHEWLQTLKSREERNRSEQCRSNVPTADSIIVPRRFDVLFGRGKIAKTHTGNLRALHLCEMNYPRYESNITGKYGKTEVAEQIVGIIHESGGRFLKPSDAGGWEEVDDEAAREKISHFFRHMRHKVKAQRERDTSSSDDSSGEFSATSPALNSKQLVGAKRVTPCPSPSLVE